MKRQTTVVCSKDAPAYWLSVAAVASELRLSARRVQQLAGLGVLRAVIVTDAPKAWRARGFHGRGDRRLLIEPESVRQEAYKRARDKARVARSYERWRLKKYAWVAKKKIARLREAGRYKEAIDEEGRLRRLERQIAGEIGKRKRVV